MFPGGTVEAWRPRRARRRAARIAELADVGGGVADLLPDAGIRATVGPARLASRKRAEGGGGLASSSGTVPKTRMDQGGPACPTGGAAARIAAEGGGAADEAGRAAVTVTA
jgi:hypothetical protein